MPARTGAGMGRSRFVRALPDPLTTLAGTVVWAAASATSAAIWLAISGRFATSHAPAILLVFALGGALAFPVALYLTRLAVPAGHAETRFAAAFVAFGLATILGVAFVFSMDYRQYYAEWHDPFPSVVWAFQFVFTGATAVYQFAVLGTRMFLPAGLIALFLVSLWHARQAR
jgi:hypothetical protein